MDLQYLVKECAMDNYQETEKRPTGQDDEIIPEGQRNNKLTSIAMALRRQGCDQEAYFAALIENNQKRCRPPLGYAELKKIAISIARYQPQPLDGSDRSVLGFVRQWCQIGGNKQTRSSDLYEAYKQWCKEAGMAQMGRNGFYEEFGQAFPDCARTKTRQDNSGTSPVWVYENIALLEQYKVMGI